jgi:YesN/AraC family two-component response regulator
MAELTGLDVAATAKGASRNTHVVLISAFSPSFIKRQIGGNLPDAILKKPVTMDTIKSVLDRLVVR